MIENKETFEEGRLELKLSKDKAVAYFNAFYADKLVDQQGKRKPKVGKEREVLKIQPYYELLNENQKKVVMHMFYSILGEDKFEANMRRHLKELMRCRGLTRKQLAEIISAPIMCYEENSEQEYKKNLDIDMIMSKLQNYENVLNPNTLENDVENTILGEVCRILNVDYNAITKGIGCEYSIDEEAVNAIAKEKNKEQVIESVMQQYIKCVNCEDRKLCQEDNTFENYKEYKQRNLYSFAEHIADYLEIDVNEILIKNPIAINIEDFKIEDYFSKLSKPERNVMYHVLQYLYLL